MIPFIAENLAPIMFGALVILLLLGYPAAFSLAANGLLFFVIGSELAPFSSGQIHLSWPLLGALPDRFFGGVNMKMLGLCMKQGREGGVMSNEPLRERLDTPENIRRLRDLPFLLFVGRDNQVLSPEATECTYDLLCNTFGTRDTRDGDGLSLEQAEAIAEAAMEECERFYPVFQFVLWGGKSPGEAIAAAMIDTHGEA